MNKLRAIVADDEADAIEVLSNILNDTNKVTVIDSVTDSTKVESTIIKLKPDVLFLDIEMPGIDGLSLLENIRTYNQDLKVVFITAYGKYTQEAIKLNVFSYLLKPVDRNELNNIIDNLLCLIENKNIDKTSSKIKLPVTDGYIYVNYEDIFYLEAEGNYTCIKTINGDSYMSSYNMGRLNNKFPLDTFYRINRSCMLNSSYLYKINKKNNTCHALINEKEYEFEVSNTFITEFNKRSN